MLINVVTVDGRTDLDDSNVRNQTSFRLTQNLRRQQTRVNK